MSHDGDQTDTERPLALLTEAPSQRASPGETGKGSQANAVQRGLEGNASQGVIDWSSLPPSVCCLMPLMQLNKSSQTV